MCFIMHIAIQMELKTVERIRRVFKENLGILFVVSPNKYMLWVLIRIANEYLQHMFYGEVTKYILSLSSNTILICVTEKGE